MTLQDVWVRMVEVCDIGTRDPERGHAEDDKLRSDFLRALVAGEVPQDEIVGCAECLLWTDDAFPHWCA